MFECNNSRYKRGDWVRFMSEQPDVYLTRYVQGQITIEKREYTGVINNVAILSEDVLIYTIETIPVHWICLVGEEDIIEKLT